MSNPLDPERSFANLKDGVAKAVKEYFPKGEFKGKKRTLRLKSIEAEDKLEYDDFVGQQEVKEKDGSWDVPLKAEFELVDNVTGKVIDRKKTTIARLPKITPRFSYIVDGKERQVDHQSLLKRGIYSRIADNGKMETRFNTKTPDKYQTQFQVFFDPESYGYTVKTGDTEVPLVPVLKAMGVSEKKMKDTWGSQILQSNSSSPDDDKKHLKRLFRRFYRKDSDDFNELIQGVRSKFSELSLDPEVTEMTVGKKFDSVSGDAFLAATKTLIDINRGEKKPSGYDDLRFKEIRHTEDYIPERIRAAKRQILPKLRNNIDRVDDIGRIVSGQTFGKPVKAFFTNSQLSVLGDQTNPLGMLSGHTKHTILGEGGISSSHQVTQDAKIIHPSTYGFKDPVHTPESDRTGVSLQIPLGAWKEGNQLVTTAVNARTGKIEKVTAKELAGSNLAFPDQYKMLKGKPPKARNKRITVADKDGGTSEVDPKEVDYVVPNHANLFSATTNLVPFLQNNNGNRVGYGTQQAHQALSLVHREEPLVQSATGSESPMTGEDTFEGLMGQMMGHRSKATGTVTKVTDTHIHVKDGKGKTTKHALYKDFPLNNKKGVMNSTALVKPGDKVKKGDTLADHSFTKNGKLALGSNLSVGYVPADGYNFEDGIVISESAAKKMTSEHMYKKELDVNRDNIHVGKRKFKAMDQVRYTKEQLERVGDDGVVAVGTRVKPGDPLVLSVKKNVVKSEAEGLARVSKGMVKDWKADPIEWEGDNEGVVTKVIRTGKKIKVHVKAEEPMQVGDKLVGRHGNKGIVTQIRPDSEMPEFDDPVSGEKRNLQVMLNPLGVPGRINAGQLLETSASLIAKKTGKPYKVKNFDPNVDDYTEKIEEELAAHGLKATTKIKDPKTGKSMGEIHLGDQYMLKLDQQVSKKMSARGAGYGNPYDGNKAPTTGGGRLGSLGNYALLAHGAKHNLREMQTIKTSFDDEVWRAIQKGDPIPTPRPSFAYEKFESYLKGMGVNINKEGNQMILEPLTDKQVDDFSSGEVKDAGRMLRGKDLRAENGGLFDPNIFGKDGGGLKGTKWGHIELDTPMPNPMFEEAILKLTGLKGKEFSSIIAGEKELDGQTGPGAIGAALDKIDVKGDLKKYKEQIKTAPKGKIDQLNKKIRFLKNLDRMGLSAREAYMKKKVPVLPPIVRPVSELPDGSLNTDDVNGLYRGLGLVNNKLKDMDKDLKQLPEESGKLHASLYDGLKALTGAGTVPQYHYSKRDKLKSIMDKIEGSTPKTGFFQAKVMSRKQDMSMRSTIIPNQKIKLDEIALPRAGALQMFQPHLVRELRNMGYTTLTAKEAIKKNEPIVEKALDKVMKDTPVLAKRDPVLHKFGVQAFKPVIAEGQAIEIHPLVTGGFNADFDGDTMGIFAPASKKAIEEAKTMLPSNNLFNPTYGSTMYAPGHEAQVGIYRLAQKGKKTNIKAKDEKEVSQLLADEKIKFDDQITVGGKQTTAGRLMLDRALPQKMRGRIAYSGGDLDKKAVKGLLGEMAHTAPKEYPDFVHKIKDLGNAAATQTGLTISLKDIKANKQMRDQFFSKAKREEEKIRAMKGLSKKEKDKRIVDTYRATLEKFDVAMKDDLKKRGSSLIPMLESGGISKWVQMKQLTGAPVMFEDAKGDAVPVPVLRSYGEGLRLADFMTAAHGARMGTLSKSQGTSAPGFLSKEVINSTMNVLVADKDCGTKKGINMNVDDDDFIDRFLAADVNMGKGKVFKAGTQITPEVRDSLRNNGKSRVTVRSPLKCAHGDGLCQKCTGVADDGKNWDVGTNIGVIAAQALGEPATQMAMNAFHCNHEDSLVFVRTPVDNGPMAEGQTPCYRHALSTMRDLFTQNVDRGVETKGIEEIIDLPEGLEVWDQFRWVPVTHIKRHPPTEDMVYLSSNGMATICQKSHPLMVDGGDSEVPVAAEESKGCGIAYSKLPSDWGPGWTYKESGGGIPAYVVGMYLAEGNINYRPASKGAEKKPYSVVFTQLPGRVADKLRRVVSEWRGSEMGSHGEKGHVINSLELGVKFEQLFGRYSHGKRLPADVMFNDDQWLADMLSGYIDGDGSVVQDEKNHNYYIQIETTSFFLTQAIPLICSMLGVHAAVIQKPWRKHSKNQGFAIRIAPTEYQARLFKESIKFESMTKFRTKPGNSLEGIGRINVVKPTTYTREFVYDLTTKTGTLTVGGLHHHNTGGVIAPGQRSIKGNAFRNASDLLHMKKTVAGSAKLAPIAGKIKAINKDPAGGFRVHIEGSSGVKQAYTPQLKRGLAVGKQVKAGDALSDGLVNPHELLPLAGLDAVKGSVTNQLKQSYRGIRRRHIETVARSLTDLARVEDAGDNEEVMPGDMISSSKLAKMNANLPKGKKPATFKPVLKGVNYLPLHMQEDWAAKLNFNRLKGTIIDGALQGHQSDLHGRSPVPGMMYGAEFGLPPSGSKTPY